MSASRDGFSLVEVLIVSVVIGILAGIAIPTLGRQIDRAAATKVVTDARVVEVAVRSFVESGDTLPSTSAWGVAPTGLEPYLQDNMSFRYRDAEYRYVKLPLIDRAVLRVRYPLGSGLGQALRRHRRPPMVTWTPVLTSFRLVN